MKRTALPFFEEHSEPLDVRISEALHKIGLALKHESWTRASAEGLSPTQGQVLALLSTLEGATGSELARRLGVTLPTISDSVGALVAKGLVTKEPDPRHPRASLLWLTRAGAAAAARAKAWPEFLAQAASSLEPHEQEAFHSGLLKMIRTLQEQGRIPISRMCVTCRHFRPRVHEGPLPHHCNLVDAPMADRHLRLECPDHEAALASADEAPVAFGDEPRQARAGETRAAAANEARPAPARKRPARTSKGGRS